MMIIPGRLPRRGRFSNHPSTTLYWMARVVVWGLLASYTGFRYRSLWQMSLVSLSSSSLSSRSISTTKQADAPITTTLLPSCSATLELIPLVYSNYTSYFPLNKLMMPHLLLDLQSSSSTLLSSSSSFSSSSSSSSVQRGGATTAENSTTYSTHPSRMTSTTTDSLTTHQNYHHYHHHHSAICLFSWHNKTNPQESWIPFLHFPHTMQIMYRCWSWWQQQQQEQQDQQQQHQQRHQSSFYNSENRDTTTTAAVVDVVVDVSWILLLPNQEVKDKIMGLNASDFNRGFFASLEQFANVSIRVEHEEDNNNNNTNKPHRVLQQGRIEKQQEIQQNTIQRQAMKQRMNLAPNHHNGQKRRLLLAPSSNNNSTSGSTTNFTTSSTSMAGPIQMGSGKSYQVASPHHLSRLRDILVSGFLGMNQNQYHPKEKRVPPTTRILTRRRTQKGNTTTTTTTTAAAPTVEEQVVSTTTTTIATTTTNAFPRVAIVNREGYRKLVNAYEIAKEVEQRMAVLWRTTNGSDSTTTTSSRTLSSSSSLRTMSVAVPPPPTTTSTTTHHIRIVSFDGWSFADQVLFMNSVDVLISPHGAQLTSIPFLPPCASIFELFPQGYHVPFYFGTLAAASGVTHSYTSLTRGFEQYFQEEIKVGMANVTNHNKCRNVQLCPPPLDLVEQIMTVIQQWHERCVAKV
jgi:hypothetical protein